MVEGIYCDGWCRCLRWRNLEREWEQNQRKLVHTNEIYDLCVNRMEDCGGLVHVNAEKVNWTQPWLELVGHPIGTDTLYSSAYTPPPLVLFRQLLSYAIHLFA